MSSEQERIDAQASEWIVRASESAPTPEEARELANWRAADPRHDRAYRELEQTWRDMEQLSHLGRLVSPERRGAGIGSRWRQLQVLAATVAIAVLAWTLYSSGSEPMRIATEVGQMRELRLPDGSMVTLGPKTQLSFSFTTAERRVTLAGGEAFFEVSKDAERPFIVDAGISSVRVVGTQFEVNRAASSVRVAVLEGVVQVGSPTESRSGTQAGTVRAGHRAEIDAQTDRSLRIDIGATSVPPGAWRKGWLAYEDTTLSNVIADLSRYSTHPVTLASPELGGLRVTAAFNVAEIREFLTALSSAIPVKVTERPDGSFTLEPA